MSNDNYRKKEKKDWGSRPVYPETARAEEKIAPASIEEEKVEPVGSAVEEPLISQEEISDRVTIPASQSSIDYIPKPSFEEPSVPEEDCSWKEVYKKHRVPIPKA